MAAYIAILLSSICIILLISVLVRFNKLFSTDSIIEKTKVQMNKIISDINKNANMDIDLINEATKRTRTLMSEADAKMEEFKEAAGILRDMIATVENQSKFKQEQNPIYAKNNYIDDIKPVRPANMNVINAYGANYKTKTVEKQYKDSFDDDDLIERKVEQPVEKTEAENKSEVQGQTEPTEYMIPKIVTNIIPDEPGSSRKSLNDKVERLFRTGMEADDIALELSCSSSEVQFIIDMLNSRG